ncbi:MAG: hypothetical protein IJQ80_03295, partial [Clostridia bacterium]|nr:hypothetical protein [Clostridia bacterium]
MRWDEDYFYVAVRVLDPDGHSLKNGRKETWNGDALQMRIDPADGYNGGEGGLWDAEYDIDGYPWSRDDIDDLCFGFVQAAGGFTEAWNNAGLHTDANSPGVGITPFLGGTCNVSVAPAGVSFSSDTAKGYTTYEMAIPWSYIGGEGKAGNEYGMSAVVYNADGTSGQSTWNAGLAWGSGIIKAQQTDYIRTCAGSNNIELVADKVSADSEHKDTYENIPGGYVPETVTPDYPRSIDESVHIGPLTYDSESDLEKYGNYIGAERVKDSDGNWIVQWDLDTMELDTSPTKSGLNDINYLSTHGLEEDGSDAPYRSDGSYTMEFDIMVTGNETFEGGYDSCLYNWFGGATTVEYECGYNFDTGKFNITETSSGNVIDSKEGDFTLNKWHHWVFQYFKDNCEMRFYFDPEMENGRIKEGTAPMFRLPYRYFDMPGVELCEVIFRRLNCQIKMDNVEFYNFVDYMHVDPIPPKPTPTPTPDPEPEPEPIDYDVDIRDDGTVAITIANEERFKKDNVSAVSFTIDLSKAEGKVTYKGLEGVSDDAVEVIENDDGTVTIKVKDLNIFDVDVGAALMKVILQPADGVTLTADEVKELVTIKATVTTTSSQTGDAVVFYVAAVLLLLAVLGTGVVICTKKRNHIDF